MIRYFYKSNQEICRLCSAIGLCCFASAIVLALAFDKSAIAAGPANWQRTLELGKKQLAEKHYAEAEKLLLKAELEAATLKADDLRRMQIYNSLLSLYYANGSFEKAESVFEKILPVAKKNFGTTSFDYAETLRNFAELEKKLKKPERVQELEAEAGKIENPELTVGYLDSKGRMPIKWKQKFLEFVNCFELPGPFSEGLAQVYQGNPEGKIVYINKEGQQAITAKWDRGLPFHDGAAQVFQLSNVALIDKSGKILQGPRHDYFPTERSEGLWPSSAGSTYLDDQGKVVLNTKYGQRRAFHEGLAAVEGEGKDSAKDWGYIDKNGKLVIPLQYTQALDFHEGLAAVQEWSQSEKRKFSKDWSYINKEGKKLSEAVYAYADNFSGGFACVGKQDGDSSELNYGGLNYGFINKSGKLICPAEFDYAENFSEGLALVHIPSKALNKKYLHIFRYGRGVLIDRAGHWAFIDKSGKVVLSLPQELREVWGFSEGLARVKAGARYGFIDRQGKLVIKPQYRWADDYSEGLAAVVSF